MQAKFNTYLGLFIFTMTNLMFEILLTRIFSVTMWYHFAFLAISLTMLGMTIGAIIVYVRPQTFTPEKTQFHMAVNSLIFAGMAVFAMMCHITSPALIAGADPTNVILFSLLVAVPLLLVAFAVSGIVVSLALTRYPAQLDRLYAVDLIGAAIGCNAIVLSLQVIDGISAVFFIAALACFSACCFAWNQQKKLQLISLVAAVSLLSFSMLNAYMFSQQKPLIGLGWTKGTAEVPVLYQKWNSFSRIRVLGNPKALEQPYGYFSTARGNEPVRQLYLDIDGSAETTLPYFDGDVKTVDYLKYDPINIAHYLRPNSDVLVIGVGGGRDLMSALLMKQKSVTGVDVNANIIHASYSIFGDYTGKLAQDPRVKIVNDEARSYVAHSPKKYDIILASVVDTWAASASGAFAMTENSLYTVDAWVSLLDHLTDTGILTVGRFYDVTAPSEFYRLTSLASEALRRTGVKDPRNHICIIRLVGDFERHAKGDGVGTILLSKQPFSAETIAKLNAVCKELKFEVVLTPTATLDPILAKLASGRDLEAIYSELPWDVSAPTDDKPFFFQTFQFRHLFDKRFLTLGRNRANLITGPLLLITAISVLFFSAYCFRIPFLKTKDKESLKGSPPLFAYFFSIGLGFMFAEISQIQRFTIFLGHPTYGATVVLFSLLLSTGVGSLLLRKIWGRSKRSLAVLSGILAVLVVFGFASPIVIHECAGLGIALRIAVSVAVLFPLGCALGLLFPMGMGIAADRYPTLTPWLWGINGAASVCGSVLTVLVAMCAGITCSYWSGVACYAGALCSIYLLNRNKLSKLSTAVE